MKILLFLLQLQITEPKIITHTLPVKKLEVRDSSKNYIILHDDGGPGGYSAMRSTLLKRRLSYHYYVKRDGTIVKLLDPKYKASHVGYSVWKGLFRLNKYSIAICLDEGTSHQYTPQQYESVVFLIQRLQKRYPDSTSSIIVGHKDVALPFGRKNDPKNFDWNKLKTLLTKGKH